MKFLVFLVLVLLSVVNASILDSFPYTPYGGFRYPNSYESALKYNRARYYAKKSKDLAQLRSAIYGLGNGFYGFRYKYRPLFPKLMSNLQLPFFDGSPATYFGALSIPGIQPSIASSIFWKYPVGLQPQNYGDSYSSKWAYGKGYSYANQNYFYDAPVNYGYTKTYNSNGPVPVPRTYFKPSQTLLPPIIPSYSNGFHANSFSQGPVFSKPVPTPSPFKGYDSIYGSKYSGSFKSDQMPQWSGAISGKLIANPDSFFNSGFNYDSKTRDISSSIPIKRTPFAQWSGGQKQSSTFNSPLSFGGFNSIYGLRYNKSPAFAPYEIPKPQTFEKSLRNANPFMEYSSIYGSKYTSTPVGKGSVAFWNGPALEEILNSPGTYSLLPPNGKDFAMIPGSYESYIDNPYVYSPRYGSGLADKDQDSSPSEKIVQQKSANISDVQPLDLKSQHISTNATDIKMSPIKT